MLKPGASKLAPAVVMLLASTTLAYAAEEWRTPGFSTPESVVFDEANDRLIVSNIAGEPTQADGNGTLSTVGPDGKIIEAEWVTGLDAPKGSAIAGGKLYVADISKLRIVDLASGEYETVEVPGATFLNDVTADESGAVYLTDTFANSIYRYADGQVELFVQDAALPTPNGILADGRTLYIASFGTLSENQADNKPGGVYTVDVATKAIAKDEAAGDFGFLDGIVKVGDAYYVSDFFGGVVHRYVPGEAPSALATLKMGSADLGTDGTDLFVPMMMEGELVKLTTQP